MDARRAQLDRSPDIGTLSILCLLCFSPSRVVWVNRWRRLCTGDRAFLGNVPCFPDLSRARTVMPSCKFPTHSESGRSGQRGRVRVANGVNRETSSSSSLYFVSTLFLETFSFPFAPVKAAPNRCGGLCSVILVTPRFSFSFFFPSPPFASRWRYCAIASLRETSRPGRCASHVFRCLFLLFLLSFLRFIDFTRKKKKKTKKEH